MAESNWKSPGYNPEEHGWWRATLDDANNFGYPNNYYFADTVRAIIIAFGKFFNDMYVVRFDENGYPRKKIQVPLKFGPRAKSHDYRREEESGKTYYIPLPNMFYKITSFQYDQARAASSNTIRTFYDQYLMSKGIEERYVDLLWSDAKPVPYNIGIELTAKADKFADILQIVEQISSRFDPDAFVFIKEFWFMNIRRDVKMKLESVSVDYQDDFGEQDKRELEAKFAFTIEGQVYTKIEHGAIIDQIILKLNPSIAVYKEIPLEISLKSNDGKFNIADPDDSILVKNGILKKDSDGRYKIVEDYESYFTHEKDSDLWVFTSGQLNGRPDPYESTISVSGNYHVDEGASYDSATNSWPGSMTDRYDFTKVGDDYSTSGNKDFLNNDNEKVNTTWVNRHSVEIAGRKV